MFVFVRRGGRARRRARVGEKRRAGQILAVFRVRHERSRAQGRVSFAPFFKLLKCCVVALNPLASTRRFLFILCLRSLPHSSFEDTGSGLFLLQPSKRFLCTGVRVSVCLSVCWSLCVCV